MDPSEFAPREFGDLIAMADAFCAENHVAVDLTQVEPGLANRMIDFCIGLVYGRGMMNLEGDKRLVLVHQAGPRRYVRFRRD